jgi:hypothetical protein
MGPRARSVTSAALICATLGLPVVRARAEQPAAAPPEAAIETPPADVIDDDAVALLKSFGDLLEAQPRFSFTVDFSYEVVQADGQKLEFGATRVYTVRRPDQLRIDEERRVGGGRELLFDGNQLTVYVPGDKAYAIAKLKKHHELDSMLDLVRDALDIQVPLGDLLRANPVKRIEEGLTSAYIVDRERLAGVECDHLAWRTDEVDAEAWFTTGDQPLLHRLVIDYRNLEGQPSFRAQFTSWNRSPDVADARFAFTPPADAERLRFSVHGRDLQSTEEQEP